MQNLCLVYNKKKKSLPCFYLTSSFLHTVSVELDALTVRKFAWSLQERRRHHLNSCSCQHWTNTAVFKCPGKSRHWVRSSIFPIAQINKHNWVFNLWRLWCRALASLTQLWTLDFIPCLKLDLGNMIKCELGSFRLEQMLTFISCFDL